MAKGFLVLGALAQLGERPDTRVGKVISQPHVFCKCFIEKSFFSLWGLSSVGRALDWQSRGHRFDPVRLHKHESFSIHMLKLFLLGENMKYTLYILKSLSTERLYIGQTSNFARRLKQHEDDRSYSTKGRGPWSVLKTIQLDTRSEAMKLEVKLKKMKNPVRIIAYVERHY